MSKPNGAARFDIGSLKSLETADMPLRHPLTGAVVLTDDGDPLIFTIASSYHPATRKGQREYATAQQEMALLYGEQEPPLEKVEHAIKLLFTHRVIRWGKLDYKGKADFQCTPENVMTVFDDPDCFWIYDQVRDFVAAQENFFAAASKSSGTGRNTGGRSRRKAPTARASKRTGAPSRRGKVPSVPSTVPS